MAHKVVVTGDIDGSISAFFAKLSGLQAKQQFAFAIIAGNLFASDEDATPEQTEDLAKLIKGEIEVPVTTYFSVGRRALPSAVVAKLNSSDGELCPNLISLGRKGRVKTSEGFRIVTIGGMYSSDGQASDAYTATYSDKDASAAKGYNDADILVTSEWPASIRDGSREQYVAEAPPSSEALSELCTALKPRYHFSSSEAFWEREPFFHQGDPPRPVTRFLSLAPFGNTAKSKWIYAFSLQPAEDPPQQLPPTATASPFFSRKRKALASQNDEYKNLRFSNGGGETSHFHRGGRGGKRRRGPAGPPDPSECYFCLSNPQCESHMIGSIGSEAYLTTAKGPLTLPTTFPSLGFPGHVLVIPVQHAPTLSAVPSTTRVAVTSEMQKYRTSLHSMISARNKSHMADDAQPLGAVTWSISRASGVHLHWQFLPVPRDLIARGLVQAGFEVEAENLSYPSKFLTDKTAIEIVEKEGREDFFKVSIWWEEEGRPEDGGAGMNKELLLPLDDSFRFDLQFGRRVLGKLLGLEKRAHWKDCAQSRAEEEAECEVLKEVLGPYDWTAE